MKNKLCEKATAPSLTIEMYRNAWIELTNMIDKNKLNYDLLNARMNKIEEEIKAILQRMKR